MTLACKLQRKTTNRLRMRLPAIAFAKGVIALLRIFVVQRVRHHGGSGHIQTELFLIEQDIGFARNECCI